MVGIIESESLKNKFTCSPLVFISNNLSKSNVVLSDEFIWRLNQIKFKKKIRIQ